MAYPFHYVQQPETRMSDEEGTSSMWSPGEVPRVHLIFIGNFFSAVIGAWALSEDLAEHLTSLGWVVFTTSHKLQRLPRLSDMVRVVWKFRRQYEVAHVDVFSGAAFIWAEVVCWVLRRLHKPYILTLRGGNLVSFAKRWPHRLRRLLNGAAQVTTPSLFLKENLGSYYADVKLLPNALDIRRYEFHLRKEPQPRLVWLRAFHGIYNPSLAPRVVHELIGEFPAISMTMIGRDKGDGSLRLTQRVARELGVSGGIAFQGGISKDDVPTWLNKGDIFLNTTNVDNTPVSVIEAMAVGMCIVTTNVGGLPYLLKHEYNALLVPPDDPEAMAGAVRRILTDPALAEQLSRHARETAAAFDWSKVLPQWVALFQGVAMQARRVGARDPRILPAQT